MNDVQTKIAALLLDDLTREASSGFPTARRIPSTHVVKFLDYFAMLDAAGRQALLKALAAANALQFLPPPPSINRLSP